MEPRPLQFRSSLLAEGWTDRELRRMRRSGALTDVRRGSYAIPDDERLATPEGRHAMLVEATLPGLAPGAVVSHVSAAVLHGLPVWNIPLRRVHGTRDARSGGRISSRLHLHASPLDPADVVEIDGVPVTSLARTAVDLARTVAFEQAVVVADGALRALFGEPAALRAAHERAAGWPGAPKAKRVLDFADGRSESAGESRSRVAIHRLGLPRPVLQWEVATAGGVHRVDFAWPELATVGEFDGLIKYRRLVLPGQDPADVVVAEKLREDDLRGEHLGVVRWIWPEIERFDGVARRLRRSFAL